MKRNVLVIEDDADHAELIRAGFEDHDAPWSVQQAGTLAEARRALRATPPPDLVIIDLLLPDGRGTELLPNSPEAVTVPIILMTSNGNEDVAVAAIKSGALDYVVKSETSLMDLPRIAERALREWEQITKRRQAEELVLRQQAEMAHVLRVSTMGELATGLAHELNQPLAAIVNYADASLRRLDTRVENQDAVRANLRQIMDQAERAGDIIRRLRALVRKTEPQYKTAAADKLIHEVVELIERETGEANVAVRVHLDHGRDAFVCDSIQIQQVILNLLRNSIQAMRESHSPRRELSLSTARLDDDSLEITVSDTGSGFESGADSLENIFQPFFSTRVDGLGMGLAISRRMVEAHGGRIWAENHPGAGMTVKFTVAPSLGEVSLPRAPLDTA